MVEEDSQNMVIQGEYYEEDFDQDQEEYDDELDDDNGDNFESNSKIRKNAVSSDVETSPEKKYKNYL